MEQLSPYRPFFVQIGAMDGKSFDRIYPYVQQYKWPGLLVEPMPKEFEKLKANYAWHNNIAFENSAIKRSSGCEVMYYVEVDRPKTARGLSTFYPQKNNVRKYPESVIHTIEVRCITPKELLQKHSVSKVDLLAIDAEGCDLEILVNWDFNSIRPKVIICEAFQVDRKASLSFLEGLGYFCVSFEYDIVAWRFPGIFL
jgi:FkbM family methyltransferase